MFAIVDIETTGLRAANDKITDIAIIIHDGNRVVDSFTSLIDPECNIPPKISMLTGINNEMVQSAPKFYEVAKEIFLLTEGNIFVAHNVNFDYSFIRQEFKRLGGEFNRKRLCTVRLSRKIFPGLPSYGLGRLCSSLNIKIHNRHRAEGDALATLELFEKLLTNDRNGFIDFSMNSRSREATLPPNLPKEVFYDIPETRNFLQHVVAEYNLCPKLCNLQTSPNACFDHQIKKCKGACIGKEASKDYNKRVRKAIKRIKTVLQSFIIVENGRDENESAIVLVENGKYKGFGYVDKDQQVTGFEQAREFINPFKDNKDVQRILNAYLRKSSKNVIEKQTT